MPKFTIEISQKALDRVQQKVQEANENNGLTLTLTQWLELHLNEIAIIDDLQAAVTALEEQHKSTAQDALAVAVRAARDDLLAGLNGV